MDGHSPDDVTPQTLELSYASLFAGWVLGAELHRRMVADGVGDLRFNDGVVFQHVLAGPLSITDLAGRMGVTQQAASKAVAHLERRGLLERRNSPTDARARLLHLTASGRAAIEAGRRYRATLDAELADEFGADRVADARTLLAAVITRFGADEAVRSRRIRPPA
jgi:DNA-binding MarR family transcriptional regulator